MNITIFGVGYVGLVTGLCFAEVGHHVICVDIDSKKIDLLNQGIAPIYEPGLEDLLIKNLAKQSIQFTTNFAAAVHHATLILIAVGTPAHEDGSAEINYVLSAAQSIAKYMKSPKLIVTKSTIPVGTTHKIKDLIQASLTEQHKSLHFTVASNPEFLKEGSAIDDFMKPDRIIIGVNDQLSIDLLKELYLPFTRNHDRIIVMDILSSELTKYTSNAMLATKISFMNEISNIAERIGADIEKIRAGIGSDPRIGYDFIYPGCGYGGSCFPKDVKALIHTAKSNGYQPQLLDAVNKVNERQKILLFEKIQQHFANQLSEKTFAVWGLSFKPNTDDIREAPSLNLIAALQAAGATVKAYDPCAMPNVEKYFGTSHNLVLVPNKEDALVNADGLIICTEWQAFRVPDFEEIKKLLKHTVIFDGRNIYDPIKLHRLGFSYYAIGRGLQSIADQSLIEHHV